MQWLAARQRQIKATSGQNLAFAAGARSKTQGLEIGARPYNPIFTAKPLPMAMAFPKSQRKALP
jgi:hypothetical protein